MRMLFTSFPCLIVAPAPSRHASVQNNISGMLIAKKWHESDSWAKQAIHAIDSVVSQRHNFIYFDSIKAGSATIREILQKDFNATWEYNDLSHQGCPLRQDCINQPCYPMNEDLGIKCSGNGGSRTSSNDFPGEFVQHAFKFSFVRNPLANFETGVIEAKRYNSMLRKFSADQILELQIAAWTNWTGHQMKFTPWINDLLGTRSFEKALALNATFYTEPWLDEHFQPSSWRLSPYNNNKVVALDFIGHLERLEEQWPQVLARFATSANATLGSAPQLRESKKSPFRLSPTYIRMMCDSALYGQEWEYFGYELPIECVSRPTSRPLSSSRHSAHAIFIMLAKDVFDRTMIICYKESCQPHRPGGGVWPDYVQDKIVVLDGADVDKRYKPSSQRYKEAFKKHAFKVWFTHAVAIETAYKLNLNTVLLMEEDLIASEFTLKQLNTTSSLVKFRDTLKYVLPKVKWQALKITANYARPFQTTEYKRDRKKGKRSCPNNCICRKPSVWRRVDYRNMGMTLCHTEHHPLREYAKESKDKDSKDSKEHEFHAEWCDFRNSAGYAVHKSAFHIFLNALSAVRHERAEPVSQKLDRWFGRFPSLDFWEAASLGTYHLLPSIGVQKIREDDEGPSSKNSMNSSEIFRRRCAV